MLGIFLSLFFPTHQKLSVQIDENALHEILNEVDLNKNGQVELDEFLQVCAPGEKEGARGRGTRGTVDAVFIARRSFKVPH